VGTHPLKVGQQLTIFVGDDKTEPRSKGKPLAKAAVNWNDPPELKDSFDIAEDSTDSRRFLTAKTPGTYIIVAAVAPTPPMAAPQILRFTLVVQGTTPTPPPATEIPQTGAAPIPAPGLRVLIVYDNKKLAEKHKSIILGAPMRDFLDSLCVLGPDGKTREWRKFPVDQDMSNQPPLWKAAFNLPRTSVPWIIVSNGTDGFAGPLPDDLNATKELVQKFAGK
jgi:hypothetical protein